MGYLRGGRTRYENSKGERPYYNFLNGGRYQVGLNRGIRGLFSNRTVDEGIGAMRISSREKEQQGGASVLVEEGTSEAGKTQPRKRNFLMSNS